MQGSALTKDKIDLEVKRAKALIRVISDPEITRKKLEDRRKEIYVNGKDIDLVSIIMDKRV